MQLTSVEVGPFRSINEPQKTDIDPQTTVLVGMNEAGKTVFLKALHKAKDALGKEKFNLTDDYPRKDLTSYKRRHDDNPDTAVVLSYTLSDEELNQLNTKIGYQLEAPFSFRISHKYNDSRTVSFNIAEKPALKKLGRLQELSATRLLN